MNKNRYYLNIAYAVSRGSTCQRRQYGAVLVKDDRIISTGFNGAPRGESHCNAYRECERIKLNIPHGERYELCKAVHAEANAIMFANPVEREGSTLYLVGREDEHEIHDPEPCALCSKLITNAGIRKIVTNAKTIILSEK